jgi:hypothetical protein
MGQAVSLKFVYHGFYLRMAFLCWTARSLTSLEGARDILAD